MGRAATQFFGPAPWGPGEGQKVKYHSISITKSNSKILIPNLCMFSQIKDIKHIKRYFYSIALVMPQRWEFGALGRWGAQGIKIQHGHVVYEIDGDDKQNRMQGTFLP